MDADQEMHVIGLATKFQQFAAPSCEDLPKHDLQICQQFWRQRLATVFRNEDDMQLEVVDRMRARLIFDSHV